MQIRQTSSVEAGQIFVPFTNWAMMLATLGLTITFGTSDRLAGAYGVAVSTTMLMTTAILYRIMRVIWRWPVWLAIILFSLFLCIDTIFFAANLVKVTDGGWVPLLVGVLIFTIMTTWRAGVDAMHRRQEREEIPVADFVRRLRDHKINRIPGRAVFLARMRDYISAIACGPCPPDGVPA